LDLGEHATEPREPSPGVPSHIGRRGIRGAGSDREGRFEVLGTFGPPATPPRPGEDLIAKRKQFEGWCPENVRTMKQKKLGKTKVVTVTDGSRSDGVTPFMRARLREYKEMRDACGRFAKGNTVGRGNPMSVRHQAYRLAFCNALSPTDLFHLTRKLYKAAMRGDVMAARILVERAMGRVPQDVFDAVRVNEVADPDARFD
jgi:hypothetical protein